MAGIAFDQLEEMPVQVYRVLHHRVVAQGHADPFVAGEAEGLDDLAELPAVERPHAALHVPGQMDLHRARRLATVAVRRERDEIWVGQGPVPDQTGRAQVCTAVTNEPNTCM